MTQPTPVRTGSAGPREGRLSLTLIWYYSIFMKSCPIKSWRCKNFFSPIVFFCHTTIQIIRWLIEADALQLFIYRFTRLRSHFFFCFWAELGLCVCVSGWGLCSFLYYPHTSHTGNLTPLFHRSGPASHLSSLSLPKLMRASQCTCKLHPLLTCVTRLTCTLVAIDFVNTSAVVTGFVLAVV